MTERDERFDRQLRAALTELDEATARRLRPAGVAAVTSAGRRRRRAARTATGALAVVLAGGLATGGWLASAGVLVNADEPMASPGCPPAEAVAYLPFYATDDLRTRTGAVLANSPEVQSARYESKDSAYQRFKQLYSDRPEMVALVKPETLPESWQFTVRCTHDWPVVRDRLGALPGLAVVCSCAPGETASVPPAPGATATSTPTSRPQR